MFCPNCGKKVLVTAEFCPSCGQKLKKEKIDEAQEKNSSIPTTKITNKVNSQSKRRHNKKSLVFSLGIIIFLLAVGYFVIYVPTSINAVLKDNGFTTQNGYTVKTNTLSKTIILKANTGRVGHFESAIVGNNYDTSRIDAENQLGKVANILSGKVFGKWNIEITQSTYKETPTILWEYVGTKEVTRYQTSEECLNARKKYLQKQAEQQESESNTTAAVGGAIVGGIVGSVLSK